MRRSLRNGPVAVPVSPDCKRRAGNVHNRSQCKNWGLIMLDREGFRPNVGIILLNQKNQVFWGKRMRDPLVAVSARRHRTRRNSRAGDVPRAARRSGPAGRSMCKIMARTRDWLRYEVPDRFIRARCARPLQGPEADLVLAALIGRDWDLNLRRPTIPNSTPGAGTTTGCRWTWWSSSSAASTKWR